MSVLTVATTVIAACLIFIVFVAVHALATDCLQNWRSLQQNRKSAQSDNIELAEKLHQTYSDLQPPNESRFGVNWLSSKW